MNGNWCGEFAASVVRSAGGKPPPGAAVASNWLKWGQPASVAEARPGDMASDYAFRRPLMPEDRPLGSDTARSIRHGDANNPSHGRAVRHLADSQIAHAASRITDA